MNNLRVTTFIPDETFNSQEEWMRAINLKPSYRNDGTSIMKDVELDEHIHFNRMAKGIQNFTKKTWCEFVSHRENMLRNFYK